MGELIKKISESGIDKSSWVLVYAHSEIILEKLSNISDKVNNLNFKDIKEARVFNKNDELKIWKYSGEIKSRLFSEKKQNDYKVYDEKMLLWGDKIKNNILEESGKGMEIKFPFNIGKYQTPFAVNVKNYYKYDDNGLIIFYDARLVNIVDKNGKEVNNG